MHWLRLPIILELTNRLAGTLPVIVHHRPHRRVGAHLQIEHLEERLALSGSGFPSMGDPPEDPTDSAQVDTDDQDDPGSLPADPDNQYPDNPPSGDPVDPSLLPEHFADLDLDTVVIGDDMPEIMIGLPLNIGDGESQIPLDDLEIVDVSDYDLFELIDIVDGPPRLHIVVFPGVSGTATVTVAGTTPQGERVQASVAVMVRPPEPVPVLNVEKGITIHEGGSALIRTVPSMGNDPQLASQVITLERTPSFGKLFLRQDELAVGDTFTVADIIDGGLVYKQDGTGATSDSFGFSFVDHLGRKLGVFDFPITVAGPLSLRPIPNQQFTQGVGVAQISLAVNGTDAQGIQYEATAIHPLAQLRDQLGLHYPGTFRLNSHGYMERWIPGSNGQQYILLPNGNLYRYLNTGSILNSEFIAHVGENVYHNPFLMLDAQTPQNVELEFIGSELRVLTKSGYTGSFQILVTAKDGDAVSQQVFEATVTNQAPELLSISNITMGRNDSTLVLPLPVEDPDGDAMLVEAKVLSPLSELRKRYGFVDQADYSLNAYGLNEKWLQGSFAQFYVRPGGLLYQHLGGPVTNARVVAEVGPEVYLNPELLTRAPLDGAVLVEVDGLNLRITPLSAGVGQSTVVVRVFDGAVWVQQTFQVRTINHAPTIQKFDDLTISHNASPIAIAANSSDLDGDDLQWTVRIEDDLARIRQLFGLSPSSTIQFNRYAHQEQWISGSRGNVFILPNGYLYEHLGNGGIGSNRRVGYVGEAVYRNPQLLTNATAVAPFFAEFQSGQLIVTPSNGSVGGAFVTVTATDGLLTATQRFFVEIENQVPILAGLENIALTHGRSTSLPLSVEDGDGDDIQLLVDAYDPLASVQMQLGLVATPGYSFNTYGVGDKWFQGRGGYTYVLLPNGQLFRTYGSLYNRARIGYVGIEAYENPALLLNATAPIPADISIADGEILIEAHSGAQRTFIVRVIASDGLTSEIGGFRVHISNNAPALGSIPAEQIANDASITMAAVDEDGDPLTYFAAVQTLAFRVGNSLGLHIPGILRFNESGLQEKWLRAASGTWYFVLPNGYLYEYFGTGSIANNRLYAYVGRQAYLDPTLMTDKTAVNRFVQLQVVGNELQAIVLADYDGPLWVRVVVTDGSIVTDREFIFTSATTQPPPQSGRDPHSQSSHDSSLSEPVLLHDRLMDELEEEMIAALALEAIAC